jgi:crotonobetainyl-CoA:carnitine CoA-transferase CaiB-like acyl-CoA transferase
VSIKRLDDAPARPLPAVSRDAQPLQGLRVLDLTRVIAGPVAGRNLAAHGAEVLLVTAEHLPAIDSLVIDTGRGKRSTRIDLRTEGGRETLRALVRECDVFLQSYRPGALAALGFDAHTLATLRPGLVVATLSAYGREGPWGARRGFDSLVQTATGFNQAEGEAAGRAQPQPLPAQILDHASGYLLAFGIECALMRRALQGGSWQVEVSLARTGHWLRSLGRVPDGCLVPEPAPSLVDGFMETSTSGFGTLRAVRHPGVLSATPPAFTRPAVPLGTHSPAWEDGAA